MSRPPHPVAVILTVLALLIAACGGSDEATDPAGQIADDTTASSTVATDTDADSSSDSESAGSDDPESDPGIDGDADTDTGSESDGNGDSASDSGSDGPEPAADLVIDGSFVDGEIVIEDRRFEVERGSSVLIRFESDQVEHIHLHGYDILVDLVPGQPAELAFVADSPGSFEVELEDSRRFLFELLVR